MVWFGSVWFGSARSNSTDTFGGSGGDSQPAAPGAPSTDLLAGLMTPTPALAPTAAPTPTPAQNNLLQSGFDPAFGSAPAAAPAAAAQISACPGTEMPSLQLSLALDSREVARHATLSRFTSQTHTAKDSRLITLIMTLIDQRITAPFSLR
ncbi:hypothetical protein JZ751_015601 [Albula glossodonta]|uniref:Uncharacterized protein n=1 Tax=Albula glossodonta TaxID=121402 RepID=A0A8T2NR93_9TELE|nr:hypothetical protein JZ751_015601 [Albula glossodonta]